MTFTRHDDYVHARIRRDPEFASLMRQSAIELLDGTAVDHRIARRILNDHFGMTDAQISALQVKEAAA